MGTGKISNGGKTIEFSQTFHLLDCLEQDSRSQTISKKMKVNAGLPQYQMAEVVEWQYLDGTKPGSAALAQDLGKLFF